MIRSERYKLIFALLFSIPIGWFMAVDSVKRHWNGGKELKKGTVTAVRPKNGIRPVVEIKIDGSDTTVHARLMMNTPETIPERVTFYYSGDPSEEVHCREESDPIWFLLLCVLIPIGMLLYGFMPKKRSGNSDISSNLPRDG